MALRLLDSCGHYATANLEQKYTQLYTANGNGYPIIGAFGRRSNNSIRFLTELLSGVPSTLSLVKDFTGTLGYAGFGFRHTGTFGALQLGASMAPYLPYTVTVPSGVTNHFWAIRNTDYTHIGMRLNLNGTISVLRGNGAVGGVGSAADEYTVLTTSSNALSAGTYYHLVPRVQLSTTSGTVKLYVNGDLWIDLSGVPTTANAGATAAAFDEMTIGQLRHANGIAGEMIWDYCDLYFGDSDTTNPYNLVADQIGDVRIDYRLPIQDDLKEWIPLTGLNHYMMVDEVPPDDDVTYNYSTSTSKIDTFFVESAPVVGANLMAVQVIYDRRRTEGGDTTTAAVWRKGGVSYAQTAQGDPTTYSFAEGVWTVDPATLGLISAASFNASSFGYKKVT